MIYELRVYRCIPGRLPALLNRFETATLKLWEKHGIRQAGFWTTLVGESNMELTYMLKWESLAERERLWTAFMADPDWIKARAESEKDALIVANITSSFLTPTAFSSAK
ncbi:MAG: NIPSNAP family protein [Pseudolabrys sp.]|jgi:hypothetical protein